MKTRNGFVSNSSSSSFIIATEDTKEILMVKHPNYGNIIQDLKPFYNRYEEEFTKIIETFASGGHDAALIMYATYRLKEYEWDNMFNGDIEEEREACEFAKKHMGKNIFIGEFEDHNVDYYGDHDEERAYRLFEKFEHIAWNHH